MPTRASKTEAATEATAETATEATAETAGKSGQDTMRKTYEQMFGPMAGQMAREMAGLSPERLSPALFGNYEAFAAFGKQNVDALVQSGTIAAKGAEELSRAMFGFAQSTFEAGAATGKAMLGVRTLTELMALQNEYARTTLDAMLAESVKLSELSVKVANDAMEPIGARAGAMVGTFAKPAGA